MGTLDIKSDLKRYLGSGREAMLWKLDGLSERELRLPRTATGTNLLGIVKHMANVEIGYFGDTFGRLWATPSERVSEEGFDADPQADWFATESESAASIIDLYRRVWVFADAAIDDLSLDTVGVVPWWPSGANEATLGRVIVHVLVDLARHAGQADILREDIDGRIGLTEAKPNLPTMDWPNYVARLTEIADRFS